jgi:heme-degrading monooxygenase HmoA
MIREHAVLEVLPGREDDFEASFAQAKSLIADSPGFGGVTLDRCVEQPNRYLLLVEWETVEAHTEGFRGSERYGPWRELLHHFYEPFPVVEHHSTVASVLSP